MYTRFVRRLVTQVVNSWLGLFRRDPVPVGLRLISLCIFEKLMPYWLDDVRKMCLQIFGVPNSLLQELNLHCIAGGYLPYRANQNSGPEARIDPCAWFVTHMSRLKIYNGGYGKMCPARSANELKARRSQKFTYPSSYGDSRTTSLLFKRFLQMP